jgi:two-component system LytT family sensor kinase
VFALTIGAFFARLLSGVCTYFAIAVAVVILDHKRLRETLGARLEADLAQAQVQAIKMQVQPHFLFNTLHAINVLIRQDPATAERMVTRLGDLLRHTLSRATLTEVPLRNELEVLGLYLEIERVRFHDRLTIQFEVGSDTAGALVPDLLLQPLAENAIKHGLSGSAGDGVLRIRSHRDGDDLVIEVSDTGNGPAKIAPLRDGVGLSTVRTRLARLYGERQSFAIERRAIGGCTVTVRLPFHEAPALA